MNRSRITNTSAAVAVVVALLTGMIGSLALRPVGSVPATAIGTTDSDPGVVRRVNWHLGLSIQTTLPVVGDNPIYVTDFLRAASNGAVNIRTNPTFKQHTVRLQSVDAMPHDPVQPVRTSSPTERPTMKVATWSVNSVNQRLPYLRHWLQKRQPDVVALQKIRVSRSRREHFPKQELEEAGYRVEAVLANNQLASVAVLIRRGFLPDGHDPIVLQRGLPDHETDGRLLIVDAGALRIASVYAPYAPCGSRTKDEVRFSIQTKVEWLLMLVVGGGVASTRRKISKLLRLLRGYRIE